MKTLIATMIATFGFATASVAADTAFVGYGEYAFEAEAFETGVGMEFGFYDRLTVTPMLSATWTEADDLQFDGLSLGAEYQLGVTTLYGTVETDGDLEYQELTVGAAFEF